MGILDKIGFGKKAAKREEKKEAPGKEKTGEQFRSSEKKAPAATKQAAAAPKKTTGSSEAYRYLVRPILSEKATMLAGKGKYMFEVTPDANKREVRKSIEAVYKVEVEDVNIISVSGKKRRYGKSSGKTSDWKKAVITLKTGQKIPGFVEAGT
jgi:large subunit ribosomal protein L23